MSFRSNPIGSGLFLSRPSALITHHESANASKWCNHPIKAMTTPLSFLSELQQRINEVLQQSPAKDLEKNMKAMLNQGFARLDLLTREEFEVQTEVLARTRARLEALEARVAELESRRPS